MMKRFHFNPKQFYITGIILMACIALLLLPTGFEKPEEYTYEKVKAEVLTVDNSQVEPIGFVKVGSQTLQVRIMEGQFRDWVVEAPNLLTGKLELDKLFKPKDEILAAISYDHHVIVSARALDYYRLHLEWIVIGLFAVVLIAFGGLVGFQSIVSFAFTVLVIWKLLIPAFLKGYPPLFVAIALVCLICTVTILLVAGWTKKGFVALLGSFSGVLSTCLLAVVFGSAFKIQGGVLPYAESLMHSGLMTLDFSAIFLAGIYLDSSGAVMDVAMDLSASMHELVEANPNISRLALIKAGTNVARAVIGTMTTTLLLAYSGGFTSLLMLFMAQGIPLVNIANYNFIAAEFLHIMVGSFGLILTAPLTVIIGSFLFLRGARPSPVTDDLQGLPNNNPTKVIPETLSIEP